MNKIKYLEDKVEFYRQEVEHYKNLLHYEKISENKNDRRIEFLENEVRMSEDMLNIFANITTQVLAWDSIKNSVQITEDGTAKIDVVIKRDSDEKDKFNNILEAFEFDPDFNHEKAPSDSPYMFIIP